MKHVLFKNSYIYNIKKKQNKPLFTKHYIYKNKKSGYNYGQNESCLWRASDIVIILRIKQFTTGLQLCDLNGILKLKSTENTVYKFMSLPSAQTSTIYNIESGVANMFWDLCTANAGLIKNVYNQSQH